jgi:hypothetical protein
MNKGDSMIHIGAKVSDLKGSLPAVTAAILKILESAAGDDVKKAAIAALSAQFKVENVSIMNSTFTNS